MLTAYKISDSSSSTIYSLVYVQISNPLNYRDGITMTWQNARELATYEKGNVDVTYTYDPNGFRTRKQVVDGFVLTDYNYVYENGLLVQMTYGNHIHKFSTYLKPDKTHIARFTDDMGFICHYRISCPKAEFTRKMSILPRFHQLYDILDIIS